jgi:hypothetical protein
MLLAHQPSNVGEKEAATCIMWIGVCIAVLMVNAMIANPLDYTVLECDRLEEQKHNLHFSVCLVAFMAPESVSSRRNSIRPNDCKNESYKIITLLIAVDESLIDSPITPVDNCGVDVKAYNAALCR